MLGNIEAHIIHRYGPETALPVKIPHIEVRLDDKRKVVIIGASPSQEYVDAMQRQKKKYICYKYLLGERRLTSMGNTPREAFGLENLPDMIPGLTEEEWLEKAYLVVDQAVKKRTFQAGIQEEKWFIGFEADTLFLFPGFAYKLGGEPFPEAMAAFFDFDKGGLPKKAEEWPELPLI